MLLKNRTAPAGGHVNRGDPLGDILLGSGKSHMQIRRVVLVGELRLPEALGRDREPRTVLVGDSHQEHVYNLLESLAQVVGEVLLAPDD